MNFCQLIQKVSGGSRLYLRFNPIAPDIKKVHYCILIPESVLKSAAENIVTNKRLKSLEARHSPALHHLHPQKIMRLHLFL